MPKIERVCETCGKHFMAYPSKVKIAGFARFCCRTCIRPGPYHSFEERFWAKVDKSAGPDGCWIWLAACRKKHYGEIIRDGKIQSASRVAYELLVGPIPEGLLLRHVVCNNPPCVNPAHLLPGTYQDNADDCTKADRHRRGEQNHTQRKFTAEQVRDIRARCADGMSQKALAKELGVRPPTIGMIVRRKNYRWVS